MWLKIIFFIIIININILKVCKGTKTTSLHGNLDNI